MITDIHGIRVGHWTDAGARTGCTVVLLPSGTCASGEVRGGAPATREFALLEPHRLVDRVDAVVLTGGSAFGLASADGVVAWCEERGIGFPTVAGPVPIVVAMGLFDLAVGDASVRPGRAEGMAACVAASTGEVPLGAVGAGVGATVGKWRGPGGVGRGGMGSATERSEGLVVSALVAVNAYGDVLGEGAATPVPSRIGLDGPDPAPFGSTTIGVIATNAALDKTGCLLVAQSGHDGYARALHPTHTRFDGDAVVAVSTGSLAPADATAETTGLAQLEVVRSLAVRAMERAIRTAVQP